MPHFSTLFRIFIGALLLVALISKRRAPLADRITAIRRYRLVPPALQPLTLAALEAAEGIIGISLLLGLFPRVTSAAGAALFLSFSAAMAQAIARGIVTECGCFGSLSSARVSWRLVGRNVVIAAILMIESMDRTPLSFVSQSNHLSMLLLLSCGLAFPAVISGVEASRLQRGRARPDALSTAESRA